MKDPTDYNVRAVERALQILNCFDDSHPERGLTEISQFVDLHKATTHRIVTTLVNNGYLERTADNLKYRLGLRLANLGFKVISRMDVRKEALPLMTELIKQWDETVDLSVFDNGEVLYIEVLRGNRALQIAAEVGQRLPAYCTASGKVFLASLPEADLEAARGQPMSSHTPKTVNSWNALRKQLEEVRTKGFAVDDEEMEVGILAISAPVRDQTGKVVAAISIPCPLNRMTSERKNEIATSLLTTTHAVSRRLGWNL
jgi:IclR family transcriptional regulator, KDG regulon repressor